MYCCKTSMLNNLCRADLPYLDGPGSYGQPEHYQHAMPNGLNSTAGLPTQSLAQSSHPVHRVFRLFACALQTCSVKRVPSQLSGLFSGQCQAAAHDRQSYLPNIQLTLRLP